MLLWPLSQVPLCEGCAERGEVAAATEVDHVERLAVGGSHSADNLRSLCKSCYS
ncbi:HNH endonuclease [Gemmata sp.]|uniref:HNH endonuclease n=1 Tax=Gemmata sp. TaxID=1914242 RepID=UPI003F6F754A